jgi:hypothetical protein
MAPRKKVIGDQLSLAAASPAPAPAPVPAATAAAPLPTLVEYQMDGQPWRCERFDLLAGELGSDLQPSLLATLHLALSGDARRWQIVRRLFGLQPVIPPRQANVDDLRRWEREELREQLGLTRAQLQAEVDAVRGVWQAVAPRPDLQTPAPSAAPAAPAGELLFVDDALLRQLGLKVRIGDADVREWFAQRARELQPLFGENLTKTLARNLLMTELQLRQMDDHLATSSIGGEYRSNQKVRQELDKVYRDQIAQIADLAPWFSQLAGKHAFKDVVSDITRGMQEYYARGDRRLVDGIFTTMEIRIELRTSVQAPQPKYRAGLVVAFNAAKAGLWDRNYKCPFQNGDLKKIDAGWKAAAMEVMADLGEAVPDLEQDGAAGEYEDLVPPSEPPQKGE